MNNTASLSNISPNKEPAASPKSTKKSGILYKRSDHLKQWRKRFFQAENQFLKVSHDESGSKTKIIDITDYALKWNNKVKDKFVFSLVLLPGKKSNTIKSLVLASKDENIAKEWYNFFNEILVT